MLAGIAQQAKLFKDRRLNSINSSSLNFAASPVAQKRPEYWRISILVIALMPVLHVLATWDPDGELSRINHILRVYSLPIILLETGILLLAFIGGWRPHQQVRALPKPIRLALFAFILLGSTSSALANGFAFVSILNFGKYILQGLLLGALFHTIKRSTEFDFQRWTASIAFGGFAYVMLLALFCLLVVDPTTFRWTERLPSATNIRQIGNVVGLLAIVPVVLFLRQKNWHWLSISVIHVSMLAFVMWSGSRGGLFGYVVAIFVMVVTCRKFFDRTAVLLIILNWVVALGIALSVPSPAEGFGLARVKASISADDATSGRIDVWISSAYALKEAPLLGHGSATYRFNMSKTNGYPYNHPHNFIIQFVYDWGIIGGSLAIFLLGIIGWKIFRMPDLPDPAKPLAVGVFTGIMTIALIDGTLFYPLPMLIAIATIVPAMAMANGSYSQFTCRSRPSQ